MMQGEILLEATRRTDPRVFGMLEKMRGLSVNSDKQGIWFMKI